MYTVVGRVLNLIDLVGELRELSGGQTALILKHMRRENELVAVSEMAVDEVVEKSPLKARAHALVDPETASGELRSAVIVDETEIGAEVDVMLRREIELVRLAEVAYRHVVLLLARLEVGIGKVRQSEHEIHIFGLDVAQLEVVCLRLVGELLHLGKDRRDVLAFLLELRNLLRDLVLLSLEGFGLRDHRAALTVELEDAGDVLARVLALAGESFDDVFGIFLDIFDVKHFFVLPLYKIVFICPRGLQSIREDGSVLQARLSFYRIWKWICGASSVRSAPCARATP